MTGLFAPPPGGSRRLLLHAGSPKPWSSTASTWLATSRQECMRGSSIADHDKRGRDGRAAIIPLNDLRRPLDLLGPEIDKAVHDVVGSGRYLLGPRVEEFEA